MKLKSPAESQPKISAAELLCLVRATERLTAATLSAAIIAARGKPTSINEVLTITDDVQSVMGTVLNTRRTMSRKPLTSEELNRIHN